MEDIQGFITVKVASKMTGYNPDYLSSLIRAGKIRGQKVGRGWVTTKADVNAYFNNEPKPTVITSAFKTLKLGTIILGAALMVTIVCTVLYLTVYEHGYQEAHAQASKTTNSTVDNPIDF